MYIIFDYIYMMTYDASYLWYKNDDDQIDRFIFSVSWLTLAQISMIVYMVFVSYLLLDNQWLRGNYDCYVLIVVFLIALYVYNIYRYKISVSYEQLKAKWPDFDENGSKIGKYFVVALHAALFLGLQFVLPFF